MGGLNIYPVNVTGRMTRSRRKAPFCFVSFSVQSPVLDFSRFRSSTRSSLHSAVDFGAGTCQARCLHRGLGVAKGELPRIPGSASMG